jgi:hypothetical protein
VIKSRYAGLEVVFWFEFLVASLLSTNGHNELKKLNPFLSDLEVKRVFDLVVDSMFHSVRLGQIRGAIREATELINLLRGLRAPIPAKDVANIFFMLGREGRARKNDTQCVFKFLYINVHFFDYLYALLLE